MALLEVDKAQSGAAAEVQIAPSERDTLSSALGKLMELEKYDLLIAPQRDRFGGTQEFSSKPFISLPVIGDHDDLIVSYGSEVANQLRQKFGIDRLFVCSGSQHAGVDVEGVDDLLLNVTYTDGGLLAFEMDKQTGVVKVRYSEMNREGRRDGGRYGRVEATGITDHPSDDSEVTIRNVVSSKMPTPYKATLLPDQEERSVSGPWREINRSVLTEKLLARAKALNEVIHMVFPYNFIPRKNSEGDSVILTKYNSFDISRLGVLKGFKEAWDRDTDGTVKVNPAIQGASEDALNLVGGFMGAILPFAQTVSELIS